MSEATLVMGDDEKRQARQRSLHSPHPPLRLPGYEQEQFLGKGAFGEVWVAVDRNSGRPVAIKFYNRRASLDWSLLTREVDKLRHLFSDRHVVQLLAVGTDTDPPYYVMEYMENGSLEDLLRSGPLPSGDAVALFRDIVIGLVHAHGKGILHCDLKPANILLDQDQKPRLADFGQARLPHEHTPSLGTLFYMAPEQADLEAVPDVRWDVYALGAVLYRMLTGELPYADAAAAESSLHSGPLETRLERYRRLLREAPAPAAHRQIGGVDTALAALVDRCLAIDPRHRFSNVQAILDALDSRSLRRARRPLLVLGAVAPALVALVMVLAAGYLFRSLVTRSERELVHRALESNRFAAAAVAERFALSVDKRWRILEQAAGDPGLRERLQRLPDLRPDSATRRATLEWLQTWIDDWHQRSDAQFSPGMRATSWFVNDRTGLQAGRSPRDEQTLERNWAYRDYFHGQGQDFPPEEASQRQLRPIRRPHRSIVYRSRAAGTLVVAFSVPVWNNGATDEPIGVLAMTARLGRLGDVAGTRAQFPVLVDLWSTNGKRGLIVEHPGMQSTNSAQDEEPAWYVEAEFLQRADRLRRHQLEVQRLVTEDRTPPADPVPFSKDDASYPGTYHDPVGGRFHGRWLASLASVLITRGRGDVLDTGWMIVVQERSGDTVEPVRALTSSLLWGGLASLLTVVVVVTGLWGVVMFLLDDPTRARARAFWRRLGVPGTSASAPSGSSSPPRSPVLAPAHAPAATTVKMDLQNPLIHHPSSSGSPQEHSPEHCSTGAQE